MAAAENLTDFVLQARPSAPEVHERFRRIHAELLASSAQIRTPDFTRIGVADLEFLFDRYDEYVFGSLLKPPLAGRLLRFRLSRRMTKSAGMTTRVRTAGREWFEIAIGVDMLFESFQGGDREVTVCGIACADRVEALLHVFEHELTHLTEHLCWGHSDCSAARFQDIAARLFLHQAHTHQLITRKERAASVGVKPGARVSFVLEGRRFTGIVNRVNRRATVLVPDPDGQRYSDGHRYRAFYVPLGMLEPAG